MRVHMTAIGGTGMGSLAGLLAEAGHDVRGSDGPLYPPMSTLLAELGIPLFEGYAASNLDWGPELVVIGNTCRSDHVELLAARERGLRCVSFPQLLGELFLADRTPVVVTGTHGKTTTSSLMAHLLREAGRDPGYLIGGIPNSFGRSFAIGGGPCFVVEGDEYDSACFDKRPKFVHYRPSTAIITSLELDHVDIYDGIEAIERAFAALIDSVPEDGRLLVHAGAARAMRLSAAARARVEPYVVTGGDDTGGAHSDDAAAPVWLARTERLEGARQRLHVERRGEGSERFAVELPMVGRHNAENALAVIAAARGLGLGADEITAALATFGGIKRRQTLRGRARDVAVIDDFAHHPTAIGRTLQALRGVHGSGRLVAVYEPRSSTSRRNVLQAELIDALAHADAAYVAPVFDSGAIADDELLDLGVVIAELAERGVPAHSPPDTEAMVAALAADLDAGDTAVVMSSGGFDGLIERLLEALERDA